MFTGLFNIYKNGVGTNYAPAGGKFNAPDGLTSINGVNTSYYVKKVALGGLNENPGPVTESIQAKTDLKQFSPNSNVEFRYAGVMVTPKGEGYVVTNPSFPSDTLHASNDNGGPAREYQVYDKAGNPVDAMTMYGTANLTVIQRSQFKTDWAGISGVPSSRKTIYNDNPEVAEKTFEKWAAATKIGAAYKAAYSTDPNGTPWWEILNGYMRIDGNYEKQSVLFTAVFDWNGHTYYTTYGIPYPVESNMIASKLQVLDDKKTLLDYSERPVAMEEAISGADKIKRNILTGGAVKLERNKTYNIECAFAFASDKKEKTTTDKSSSGATPDIDVTDQTVSENSFKTYDSSPASGIQNLSSEERSMLDDSTSGPIKTKRKANVSLARGSEQSVNYNLGLATYKNMSFTVDETFPTNGTLRVAIPDVYAQNGDNDYLPDDYIDLNFTLENTPPPPAIDKASYGDLNLGQRELRSYHHKVTVEEKNPEAPIIDKTTGEVTGYELMKADYEYATDFGTYESPQEGSEAGKWNGVPEASGSIYPIDDESWWEYDQAWPDQSEDAYYKIWLTRNNEAWNQKDEEYYRSETQDYPFTLGFSVSRSRGQANDSISPRINVSVYGISPDTDENGDLIESFVVTGKPIGTYQYSSNNYMYLLSNYIAQRYATSSSNNNDYPRIRVRAEINKDYHGESGIYGDSPASPYHNGWQDEHDTYERVFEAVSDDMELTDVKIKDSEGIVVYHATREDGGNWVVKVRGYFDKEEDYTMSVKLRQNVSSGHIVKDPTINVSINGENTTGGNVSTYVDTTLQKGGEALGLDVETTYANIAFRPKDVSAVNFNIEINNRHGSSNWRENIWNAEEDSFSDKIQCTTANLKVSPNIELYDSKYNLKNYLTFAEKLNFNLKTTIS